MGTDDALKRSTNRPVVEYRRMANSKKQILVLTYQPGEKKPFETIVDVVPLRKRSRIKRSTQSA
jgi:hypothetical protein